MTNTFDRFADALLTPNAAVPSGVISHESSTPTRRFAVYRNNVAVGLIGALEKRFPATIRIVGEEFFRGMARSFIAQHPPCSPVLMIYGDDFPEFIAKFLPARDIAYLADVARLEAARTRAYHAADAVSLAPSVWSAIDSTQLGSVRLRLHPSLTVLTSLHPIVTVWMMNSGQLEPAPIEDWQPEHAAILRPRFEVLVKLLPPGGAAFLSSLQRGDCLQLAADAAGVESGFDLSAPLAMLIGGEFVIEILSEETSP